MEDTDGPLKFNLKEFTFIIEIVFTTLSVAVFSMFIFFTTRLLKRQNQELDIYMKSSVILLGVSTIMLFLGMLFDFFETPNT
jgi:uncharacterized membrane protein